MKIVYDNIIFIESPDEFHNLKRDNIFTNICSNCGKNRNPTRFRKERINNYKRMLCTDCLNKAISNENYGVEYKFQSQEIKNKSKQTRLEKYGDENFNNREKATQTNIEKYGVDNPAKLKESCEKSKQTRLEKYGDENFNNREKATQTNIEKYGVDNPFKSDVVKDKIKITNVERYGSEYPQSLPFFKNKAENTSLKNNGYKYAFQSKDILSKAIDYRRNHPDEFVTKRIFYNNISFDSIPEFCVYLYCIYHWIPIIRNNSISFEYTDTKDKVHYVFPDFIINGQYVEIKGAHFFKPNGTMYLPYKDPEWSDDYYEYMCSIYESKRQCLIKNNVLILKDTDPWVQNCINWVNNMININLFIKSNYNNLCYGYTPYNSDISKEYQNNIGVGLTPYNC